MGGWKDTIEGIEQALDAAKHYNELWDEPQAPIIPKKNAELLYVVTGAELVEIKSCKINYGSTSHKVSIRIVKGVTYRPSVSRGSMRAADALIGGVPPDVGTCRTCFRGRRVTGAPVANRSQGGPTIAPPTILIGGSSAGLRPPGR